MTTTHELPFNPRLGEVGSWTVLPDGGVGQVWALSESGKRARVWVADGQRYVDLLVAEMRAPVDDLAQDGLFDDLDGEPA